MQQRSFLDERSTSARAANYADRQLLDMINGWSELTVAFNQVTRSMGEPDFYPFILSMPAVRKLHFIHRLVHGQQAQA